MIQIRKTQSTSPPTIWIWQKIKGMSTGFGQFFGLESASGIGFLGSQSFFHSIGKPIKQPTNQPINQSTNAQSTNQLISNSTSQPISQST